jgi:hypothetical protein
MVEIPEDELQALPPMDSIKGFTVIELGNKKNQTGVYREAYVAAGAEYNCLDWNAQDGAIAVDLGNELPEKYHGHADLVTNFGFTEHVYTDQIECWNNVARLSSKVGCHLAIVMPMPGHWEHHGVYQPEPRWYGEWLLKNGYEASLSYVNTNRRRHTIVIRASRILPFSEHIHYPNPMWIHITPVESRVNVHEKTCGIEP